MKIMSHKYSLRTEANDFEIHTCMHTGVYISFPDTIRFYRYVKIYKAHKIVHM